MSAATDEARALARSLLEGTRFGALSVITQPGVPYVARVAMLPDNDGLLTLISTLSTHTKALQKKPNFAALIGEPEMRGDPLTHPRMTIVGTAEIADKAANKERWLEAIPKAKLYYDFSDFFLFRLRPTDVHLNGGFGKAYHLTPDDIRQF
ncbi:pyridoxamine 5'-phosphate oxidase family protein [Cognatiyoonia sp. IB215446]|uniref:HugZ family pyridoxamine 5'-phosphate oxidase n=1 Tax=Cognatiyoonia sp. IB215446 TaxID=3097355 RepID=UPI002A159FDF|nr:pyridoxamine 5'-phosphate oxidase family protein [Cognatiyoonia sp. IB215446]MDX8347913.1 pyridoxamine 5'-phosphate oxidase family protein [Cognatiyoonia sp. IB215446]